MAKKENVVKFRRGFHFNIGFVIFFIIILYVLFNIFAYLTSSSVAEYEVSQGTIATNNVYRGLVLRDETVYYADQTGYINYYIRGCSKVASEDVIYSIDTDGAIAKQITDASQDGSALTSDALTRVATELKDFSDTFDPIRFSTVYSFKDDLNSELSQTLSNTALSDLDDLVTKAEKANTFYQVSAKTTGIVFYAIDGMESKNLDNFTAEDFNAASYQKTNLDSISQINASDPVFKLVTNEKWNVVVPITDELAKQLNEESTIQVRFCQDGYTTYASYTLIRRDGDYYLNLEFSNAMIRYAPARYLDIELVLNVEEGLKIPNSAITTKEFFTIPKEYFTKGNDSSTLGVLMNQTVDGKMSQVFVTPTIYYESDTAYYVDSEEVSKGDVIIKNDSSESYSIGTDTDSLQGVYNINKGYAVFKQINILYQNEEYSIVETKTAYGIALYDHIALDSSKVKENDFIVK